MTNQPINNGALAFQLNSFGLSMMGNCQVFWPVDNGYNPLNDVIAGAPADVITVVAAIALATTLAHLLAPSFNPCCWHSCCCCYHIFTCPLASSSPCLMALQLRLLQLLLLLLVHVCLPTLCLPSFLSGTSPHL